MDAILPQTLPGLFVLTAPTTDDDEQQDNKSFVGQRDSFDTNLDHLQFWTGVYNCWINDTRTIDSHTLSSADRFYGRLRKLLKYGLETRRKKLIKLKLKKKRDKLECHNDDGSCPKMDLDNIGLQQEIDLLEELLSRKQIEMQHIRDSLPIPSAHWYINLRSNFSGCICKQFRYDAFCHFSTIKIKHVILNFSLNYRCTIFMAVCNTAKQ